MKKISKSNPPNPLTRYADSNPYDNWDDFRSHNSGRSYEFVKTDSLISQGGVCAYCECKLSGLPENKKRVEHYHSKSDASNQNKNWALDWANVFMVCVGGSERDIDKTLYPRPINLSCDAYKDYMIDAGVLPVACEGYFMNPLEIIATPSLFHFDKATCEILVDREACRTTTWVPRHNQYSSIEELVEKTIEFLNLNCRRLKDERYKILIFYNQYVAQQRRSGNKHAFKDLAQIWFRERWPSFFTTRRDLLGKNAERFLTQIGYYANP